MCWYELSLYLEKIEFKKSSRRREKNQVQVSRLKVVSKEELSKLNHLIFLYNFIEYLVLYVNKNFVVYINKYLILYKYIWISHGLRPG